MPGGIGIGMGTGTISVLLELLLPETPDEEAKEPELCVDIVPVTLGRLVRDPSIRVADEEPELSVEIVSVPLGRLVKDPFVRVVDPKVEGVDGEVLVRDGWMLESEGNGIGIIVKFHEELEFADHEVGTVLHEDNGVELADEADAEGLVSEAWIVEAETIDVDLNVEPQLHNELELPDKGYEVDTREETEVELLTDPDPSVLVCETCELGIGPNGVVIEVMFNDELRLPAHGAEVDVNAGTVTMLLDEVELDSEAEVLPLATKAVVVVELAADPELGDLEPLMDVEDPASEDTKVREELKTKLEDVWDAESDQAVATVVPRKLDSVEEVRSA